MKNSIILILLFKIIFPTFGNALEYSKIEYPGCPENSFCKKETGEVRKKWLEALQDFHHNKINEEKLNLFAQNNYGIPISGWAQEEASLKPNIIMWDSPCKQHQKSISKFYISETFRKNLSTEELKNQTQIFFSRAIMTDKSNQIVSYVVPRGDAPLFAKNDALYYLREEEGKFYGLLISSNGKISIQKQEIPKELPKEAACKKEQVELFFRSAPNPSFYQGYFCKDIWDVKKNEFKTVLLGWSCN